MKLLKKFIPLAAVAAIGVTGTAQADVVASAILDITNFKLVDDATGVALNNISDITIQSGNNFGTLSADLTSVGGISTENQDETIISASGGQFNGTAQCEGSGCLPMADTDYTSLATPPTSSFAYSNNNLQGASIDLDIDTNGSIDIAAGVTSQTRADVSLITNDSGTSTSSTGTNTALTFIAAADVLLRISFDYFAEALAFVTNDSLAPSNATASTSWNLTVEDLTNGGTTTFEPGELQLTASRNDFSAGFNETQQFSNSGTFSDTFQLIAGNSYQLGIGQQLQANAQNTIPEPSILALLGFGLLIMAAPARLRRKA